MRICLVSVELADYRGGGIGTYVSEAGRALSAAGHEVWLLTREPSDLSLDKAAALRQHPFFARVLFAGEDCGAAAMASYAFASDVYQYASLVHATLMACAQSFDYIEFADFQAEGCVAVREQRLFGSYGKAVLAVTLHSPTTEIYRYNRQLHLLRPGEREVCIAEDDAISVAPFVNSPSNRLLELVRERLDLHDAGQIIRYPMTLPADLPEPCRSVSKLEDLRFLYFGRIEPRKGVDALIEAFRKLPHLQIELIGSDGKYSPLGTSFLADLQRDMPANVTVTESMPRDQLLKRLRETDVCILPSPWENWPNACIESMAEGRVVLGGEHGGMGEMIEHGVSGFVVDGSDPDDIARVIETELANALPRLAEIGRAAALRIRELSEPQRYADAIAKRVADANVVACTHAPEGLVTVVTPYYGEDLDILGAAVDSIVAQSHADWELLVVDDGSDREDKASILSAIAQRDKRIRILEKANGGLASARNHAIDAAEGEFVVFLDADDLLRPEHLATCLRAFASASGAENDRAIDAVAVQCQRFEKKIGIGEIYNALPYDASLAILRNGFGDAGAMFRASVFAEQGLRYDPAVDLYCDWAMWLDCAKHKLRVEPIPRVLCDVRIHKQSLTADQAWWGHVPLLGLLIERHLPDMTPAETRRLLTTALHGWGVGAKLSAIMSDDWPGLAKVARRSAKALMRAHGWLKDRR